MTWPAAAQAVRPTGHAVGWGPLLGVVATLVVIATSVRLLDGDAGPLPTLAVATLAGVTLVALDDPAGRLLAPMPVSAQFRSLLRVAMVMAPAALALAAVTSILPGEEERPLASGLALSLSGLALAFWLPPDRAIHLAAALPVTWVFVDLIVGDLFGVAGQALGWWHTQPLLVSLFALLAIVLGSRR